MVESLILSNMRLLNRGVVNQILRGCFNIKWWRFGLGAMFLYGAKNKIRVVYVSIRYFMSFVLEPDGFYFFIHGEFIF